MANTNWPKGFRAITNTYGTAPHIGSYTTKAAVAVYQGDAVAINTTGHVLAYTGTATDYKQLLGVAVYAKTAAATDRTILVYDDPNQEYEVQSNDTGPATIGALLGKNFVGVYTTGNTTTLQSKQVIDGSSATTVNNSTTIAPWRGLRFATDPSNDISAVNYTRVIVKINEENHVLAQDD